VEYLSRVDFPETNADVQTELDCATQTNLVVENQQPDQQSLHAGLMRVLARQNPNRSSSSMMGRLILCYCGIKCNVVVSKSQNNARRRFYGCRAYVDAQEHFENVLTVVPALIPVSNPFPLFISPSLFLDLKTHFCSSPFLKIQSFIVFKILFVGGLNYFQVFLSKHLHRSSSKRKVTWKPYLLKSIQNFLYVPFKLVAFKNTYL